MADRMTALEAHRAGKMPLPPGYELEHGADVLSGEGATARWRRRSVRGA